MLLISLGFSICICKHNVYGDEKKVNSQILKPNFVGELAKVSPAAFLKLEKLSLIRRPHVEMHQATIDEVVQYIEKSLAEAAEGRDYSTVRIDKPVIIAPTDEVSRISLETHNDSVLKTICLLSEKAGVIFAIRADGTFLLNPIFTSGIVAYRLSFSEDAEGREVFQIADLEAGKK